MSRHAPTKAPEATDVAAVRARLEAAYRELEAAVDESLRLEMRGGASRNELAEMWEAFLGRFLGHMRVRSAETGRNLLGWISLGRALRR